MNDPEKWKRIETALDAVLQYPEAQWPHAVEQAAGQDVELRRELQSLLEKMGGEDGVLDRPAVALVDVGLVAAANELGARIGAYRIVALIGRGGMGEVYRAERADGQFEHQVALKLIRPEAAEHLERFHAERQILARLEHPGIARLLDGGVTEDHRPFMVMELVDGRPIVEWCREKNADLSTRLRLFEAVCDAVAYAHRNLVVHRDLKPANVLVTNDGAVKLLDFGVAKLLSSPSDEQTLNVPLTPGYAAPEQLTGGAITTSTDVYALGMLLFELLCGELPWRLRELPFSAALEKILHDESPAPSRYAAQRSDAPIAAKLLRGDLDAIVAKTLRKEPQRRYETVIALREDIVRSMNREPVAAREGVRLYVFGRFLRRHRVLVASAMLVLLVVIAAFIGVAWQASVARTEAKKAEAVKNFLLDIFRQNSLDNPEGASARQATAEQLLDIGSRRIHTELHDQPEVRDEVVDTLGELYDQLEDFDKVIALKRDELADLLKRKGDRPSKERAAVETELGRALLMSGDSVASEQQLNQALHTMDDLGDFTSATRALALIEIGRIGYHSKPLSDPTAERSALAAVQILEKYDPHNPDRLDALQLLSRDAERKENFADAERYYRTWLAAYDTPEFSSAETMRATAADDFGSFLAARQRFAEAEPLLRNAVAVLSKSEAPGQLDLAVAQSDLGVVLLAMNRAAEAEALLTTGVEGLERTQGKENTPSTAAQRVRLAALKQTRGEFDAADRLLAMNVAILSAKPLQNTRRYEASTQAQHGRLLLAMGRNDDARRALERSQTLMNDLGYTNKESFGIVRSAIAELELVEGHTTEAIGELQKIIAQWPPAKDYLPAPYVLATLTLIRAELQIGARRAAVQLAEELLSHILASSQHEYLGDWESRTQQMLGVVLIADRRSAEAEPHLRRAVALRTLLDVPDSPWLASARIDLAECLIAKGDSISAAKLLTLAGEALGRQTKIASSYRFALQSANAHLRKAQSAQQQLRQ